MSAAPSEQQSADFARSPGAPRAARAWAAPLLHGWRLDGLADAALLVVSELVANAVMHGDGDIRVALSWRPGGVRIEVCDESEGQVEVVQGEADRATGRGLQIVAALAERWGVDRGPDGKAVWAELRAVP